MALSIGSSIVIVNPFLPCGQYKAGDVLALERVEGAVVYAEGVDMAIGHDEYVLVERGESDERKNHLRSGHFVRNLKGID